jgi:predicted DnaQ family exonuclease/DinG family helicase
LPDIKELLKFTFISFDIETTGLSKEKDEIIEIGAVKYKEGVEVERFSEFIKPRQPVPFFIKQLTHITDEQIESGKPAFEVLERFRDFIGDDFLVAHNSNFDLPFVSHHMMLQGFMMLSNHVFDTLDLARIYLPFETNHKLTTVAEFFGVVNESAHRAIHDAETTAIVFVKLLEFIDKYIDVRLNSNLLTISRGIDLDTSLSVLLEKIVDYQRKYALIQTGSRPKPPYKTMSNFIEHTCAKPESYDIEQLFQEDSYFSAKFPDYEKRNGQIVMSKNVEQAFLDKTHLLVEAGTGVGKSIAYLIPAIKFSYEKRERVVISTNTKNLQEQLFFKDIPVLKEILPIPFTAGLVKGRDNYICNRYWENVTFNLGDITNPFDLQGLLYLIIWNEFTVTGDVSENSSFDKNRYGSLWRKLLADRYICSGKRCSHYKTCHYMHVREKLKDANIIIINHSLMLSDLNNDNSTLGEYDCLICDEAHNLPDIASKHMGFQLNYADFTNLANGLYFKSKKHEGGVLPGLMKDLENSNVDKSYKDVLSKAITALSVELKVKLDFVTEFFETLADQVKTHGDWNKLRLKSESELDSIERPLTEINKFWSEVCLKIGSLHHTLSTISTKVFPNLEEHMLQLEGMDKRISEVRTELDLLLSKGLNNHALWLEGRQGMENLAYQVTLNYAPLDVSSILNEILYNKVDTIVFTSATLALRDSFKYFRTRMGINLLPDEKVSEIVVESPFDYSKQARLITASFLPEPKDKLFLNQCIRLLDDVLMSSRVGTLALFTSFADLNSTYDALAENFAQNGITLLAQGKGGNRTALLNEFRKQGNAVLLGTSSFWEGVDVPGKSLELLIMNKLPFQVPSEPIVEAYIEMLEKEGKDSFMHFMVPNALLKLRQGFGRLIRTKKDRGVILMLDNRINTKRYGKYFKEVLPIPSVSPLNIQELLTIILTFLKRPHFDE